MDLCIAIILAVFRMVVIPVQFEDRALTCTAEELKASVQQAEDYFNSQPGLNDEYRFDLATAITLPKPVSYYGANYSDRKDVLLHEAVRYACTRSGIDFSLYDNNSDGSVDNVFIITAGLSEADGAGEDWIWPQHGFLKDRSGTIEAGGRTINSFCVSTELSSTGGETPTKAGIGVFCHEFGHFLGLSDLYDTDGEGSGGLAKGLWDTGIMDNGCKNAIVPGFCAVDLDILGTGRPGTLRKGSHTLQPFSRAGQYLKAAAEGRDEYFLFECKEGQGLAIYHVDKSGLNAGWSDYYKKDLTAAERWKHSQVNCRPDRQCAALLAADPDNGKLFFSSEGRDSFSSDSSPAFRFWNDSTSTLALKDIRVNRDGSVSFEVTEPLSITGTAIFQDAAIISWTVDKGMGTIEGYDIEYRSMSGSFSASAPADALSCTLTGLSPHTHYKYTVRAKYSDGSSASISSSFLTKVYRNDSYPYIYLKGSDRKADGRFEKGARIPLRVFNAPKAAEVKWYFNGKSIQTGPDGYYSISEEGTLKAEMLLEDGSTDILIKEVRL